MLERGADIILVVSYVYFTPTLTMLLVKADSNFAFEIDIITKTLQQH